MTGDTISQEPRSELPVTSDGTAPGEGLGDSLPGASKNMPAFFKTHGIDPEIADARGYRAYSADNLGPVQDAAKFSGSQRGFNTRVAKQSDGFIFERHAPKDLSLDPVLPQLRPDNTVETKPPKWHYHPTELKPHFRPLHPETGKLLKPWEIRPAKSMGLEPDGSVRPGSHIARKKDAGYDHAGVNDEEVHCHRHRAKYLLPSGSKKTREWDHNHLTFLIPYPPKAKRGENMKADHLANCRSHYEKNGADFQSFNFNSTLAHHKKYHRKARSPIEDPKAFLEMGEHRHSDRVKDYEGDSRGKRIDVNPHPHSYELLESRDRVFFMIEGCIKADAILSAGEAVFSVPSVTLWDAKELPAFGAKYLQGTDVIVAPDADWHENLLVWTQALFCLSRLRAIPGVGRVCVAAPPIELYAETSGSENEIKGYDDYLAAGHEIDDLAVILREAPDQDVLRSYVTLHTHDPRSIETSVAVLEALALHASREGELQCPYRAIARIMSTGRGKRVDHPTVKRGLEYLEKCGAITITGSLDTTRGDPSARYGDRDPYEHWVNSPIITVIPELRASTRSQRLADWTEEGMMQANAIEHFDKRFDRLEVMIEASSKETRDKALAEKQPQPDRHLKVVSQAE